MRLMAPIPFIDLAAQRARLGSAVDEAILRVVDHGGYIMGPEVATLEAELAGFCGAKHVISCANGTDALAMVLMAKGVRPGDAVFCPSFTFAATAEVVAWLGATPVFVDVLEDSFNLDPASLERVVLQNATAGRFGISAAATGTGKHPGSPPVRVGKNREAAVTANRARAVGAGRAGHAPKQRFVDRDTCEL